jgi:glyoxylase-like metal-dependent hydrolase (beta-lactamase superfamily II)
VPPVVDRYPLGPYQANCYVIRADRGAQEAAVVDPGAEPAQLRLELARSGARCAGILVTHTDVDHIGGVAELAEGTGAEVWCPKDEADVLRDPGSMPRSGGVQPYEPEHLVDEGDEIALAGLTFEVVSVPGHSLGHVAYATDGMLFSGDVLFAGSVGRTDLTGGDWETLLASIRGLVDRFPPETIVYSGHGGPTTLGAELDHNPFLAELRAAR